MCVPACGVGVVQEVVEPVETLTFRDGFTTERFGESVMVTTYLGIPPADDSSDDEEDEEERSKRRGRNI